ncbi:MAG: T9SS type A sorting domain-containing protein [Cytophagaceae bacterium]
MSYIFTSAALIAFLLFSSNASAQIKQEWDALKQQKKPVLNPSFAGTYSEPELLALTDYGWEDGIHISKNGLYLYSLYYPGDLLSWTNYFLANISNPDLCTTFGNTQFLRPYADHYGMDLKTNPFGCDSVFNVDIVFSNRNNLTETFTTWQLSNLKQPVYAEASPMPLFSYTDPDKLHIFAYTMDEKIWFIKNTDPSNLNSAAAYQLPDHINPVNKEFIVDNVVLEWIDENNIIMVYEKYTNPEQRKFMYSISNDKGDSWSEPNEITSINNLEGHIEHPNVYKDQAGNWSFYYSLNFDIVRSYQIQSGNWQEWSLPEVIVSKGDLAGIGEPSITVNGDIVFVGVMHHQSSQNSNDKFDADPWTIKNISTTTNIKDPGKEIKIYPNPATDKVKIETEDNSFIRCIITDLTGKQIAEFFSTDIDLKNVEPGFYILEIESKTGAAKQPILKK